MSKNRAGQLVFAIVVLIALFVIGRNVYRRYLNDQLIRAVKAKDVNAARSLLDRGANVSIREKFDDHDKVGRALLDMITYPSDRNAEEAAKADELTCLLIGHGASLSAEPDYMPSYLENACENGRVEVVRCLLQKYATGIKHSAKTDAAAMTSAVRYYKSPEKKITTTAPAKPNTTENALNLPFNLLFNDYMTAAQHRLRGRQIIALLRASGIPYTPFNAIELDDQAAIKSALDAGLPINDRNAWLQKAVMLGQIETVKMLLAHGADPNQTGSAWDNPLCAAISLGRLDIARLLLQHGAAVSPKPTPAQKAKGIGPVSPLNTAVSSAPSFLPELIGRGADVSADAWGLLFTAIRAHRVETVRYLLNHGAHIKPIVHSKAAKNQPEKSDGGPHSDRQISQVVGVGLLESAVKECPACFDLLLQAGEDIRPYLPTILLTAAEYGRVELFPRLIALGANVNASDSTGETVLTRAVLRAPTGVKALLEHGAQPDTVTKLGQTPLILAVQANNSNVTRLLLTHGAQVNLLPPHSHTARYFACKHHFTEISTLLEKAGAKAE